jgi:DNA-directed RNA polymerase subunit L
VGYSVPHPYEPKVHIRLQTKGKTSLDVLKAGLLELEEAANILDDKFIEALEAHRR